MFTKTVVTMNKMSIVINEPIILTLSEILKQKSQNQNLTRVQRITRRKMNHAKELIQSSHVFFQKE